MTKTIITRDLIPETPGSQFPMVNITQAEAQALCEQMGGRLPTSEEYERAFAIDPWPHVAYAWTATKKSGEGFELRGGSWNGSSQLARASDRFWVAVGVERALGFRCARDIADDAEAPEGWIELPPV